MNIVIYENGIFLREECQQIEIPEYIRHFDQEQSFIGITDEEMRLINRGGLPRILLLSRLEAIVKYDYKNFLRSIYSSEKEGVIINNSLIHPINDLKKKEKVLAYFLKQFYVAEVYNMSHQMSEEELRILGNKNWIEVLFWHSKHSAKLNNCVSPDSAFSIAWLNLLQRYYYSLRHYDSIFKLPPLLKRQMYLLQPFANLTKSQSSIKYEDVITALYNIRDRQRSDLYRVMTLSEISMKTKNSGLTEFAVLPIEQTNKEYTFTFDDCNNKPRKKFKLSEEEIINIRIDKNSNILLTIKTWLEEIYEEYCDILQEKYVNQIDNCAQRLRMMHETKEINWQKTYLSVMDKWEDNRYRSGNVFTPQSCYYALLLDNNRIGKQTAFTSEIVFDLLELLKHNQSECQKGLYEGMIKLNYLNSKFEGKTQITCRSQMESSLAVNLAMKYIECMFCQPYIKDSSYCDAIRNGIKDILSNERISRCLSTCKLRNFSGGFHLGIVYNIIGRLMDSDRDHIVFAGNKKELDKIIAKSNNQFSAKTKKLIDRRHFLEINQSGSIIEKYGIYDIVNSDCNSIILNITR